MTKGCFPKSTPLHCTPPSPLRSICKGWGEGGQTQFSPRLFTDDSSVESGDEDLAECIRQAEATETKLLVTLLGEKPPKAWPAVAERSPRQLEIVTPAALALQCGLSVKPVQQMAKARFLDGQFTRHDSRASCELHRFARNVRPVCPEEPCLAKKPRNEI